MLCCVRKKKSVIIFGVFNNQTICVRCENLSFNFSSDFSQAKTLSAMHVRVCAPGIFWFRFEWVYVLFKFPCPLNTTITMLHQLNLTKSFVYAWLMPFNVHVRSIGHKLNCVLSKHEIHSAGTKWNDDNDDNNDTGDTQPMMMMVAMTMHSGREIDTKHNGKWNDIEHSHHSYSFPLIFTDRTRTFMTSSENRRYSENCHSIISRRYCQFVCDSILSHFRVSSL